METLLGILIFSLGLYIPFRILDFVWKHIIVSTGKMILQILFLSGLCIVLALIGLLHIFHLI